MPARIRLIFSTVLYSLVLFLSVSTLVQQTAHSAVPTKDALLEPLRGKVVLLDFWASWCEPCRKSFPWMNELQKKYGQDGLAIVAVNLDQDPKLAQGFLKAIPARFRIEYDSSGSLATEMKVVAMPTSFILDRQGHVVKQHAGFREAQTSAREAEIQQLLKEAKP